MFKVALSDFSRKSWGQHRIEEDMLSSRIYSFLRFHLVISSVKLFLGLRESLWVLLPLPNHMESLWVLLPLPLIEEAYESSFPSPIMGKACDSCFSHPHATIGSFSYMSLYIWRAMCGQGKKNSQTFSVSTGTIKILNQIIAVHGGRISRCHVANHTGTTMTQYNNLP